MNVYVIIKQCYFIALLRHNIQLKMKMKTLIRYLIMFYISFFPSQDKYHTVRDITQNCEICSKHRTARYTFKNCDINMDLRDINAESREIN